MEEERLAIQLRLHTETDPSFFFFLPHISEESGRACAVETTINQPFDHLLQIRLYLMCLAAEKDP